MRRFIAVTVACSISAFLAACTTHLQGGGMPTTGIADGATYHLPEVVYDVEVKRTLATCPELPASADANPLGQLTFDVSATATARTVAGAGVVIDYVHLANMMKTSDFALELYPTGILKSVNVTVDDRTADVAAEAFKAAVSIGKMAIGLPGGGLAATEAPVIAFVACSENAAAGLAEMPNLRKKVRASEVALKKATKALDDFSTEHPETPRAAEVVKAASELIREKRTAQEALDADTKAVAAKVATITLVTRLTYTPDPTSHAMISGLPDADAEPLRADTLVELRARRTAGEGKPRWLIVPLGTANAQDNSHAVLALDVKRASDARWAKPNPAVPTDHEDAIASATVLLGTELKSEIARKAYSTLTDTLMQADLIIASGSLSGGPLPAVIGAASACNTDKGQRCGILYRTKVPGRLRVCRASEVSGLPDAKTCLNVPVKDERVIFSEDRPIPQLGGLASLGFSNGAFANNTLTAEFSEDGALIKFGYKKPRAQAVEIGKTVNAGLDAATSLITYSNGAQVRDLGEQKSLYDAQAAAATALAAVPPAQPTAVTQTQNETALLQEQLKKVQAQLDLRKKQQELDALTKAADTQ